MRVERYVYNRVDVIPEKLQPGVLYHAAEYATALHLCACGCKREVTTGIGAGHWVLEVTPKGPTLWPSIGNGSFPCKSHYFIVEGGVRWAGVYTKEMIALARRIDNPRAHQAIPSFWKRVADAVRKFFKGSHDKTR